jgi:hypothetical protein
MKGANQANQGEFPLPSHLGKEQTGIDLPELSNSQRVWQWIFPRIMLIVRDVACDMQHFSSGEILGLIPRSGNVL